MNARRMFVMVTMLVLSLLTMAGMVSADSDAQDGMDGANILIRCGYIKCPDLVVSQVTTFNDHVGTVIRIKNQGNAIARAPFKVVVWKNGGGSDGYYTVNVSLARGQTLTFNHIFSTPYGPGCTVHVTVDWANQVKESNENNNSYDACTY